MDLTHALLTVVLVLAGLVLLAILLLVAIGIKAAFEVFALARAIRTEVSTIGTTIGKAGEMIAGRLGAAAGLLDFLKPAKPARKAIRKTKE